MPRQFQSKYAQSKTRQNAVPVPSQAQYQR